MTECERIIRNGILPVSFFEEETICDFLVTSERKKIWAVLLDLLIQIDHICRKHGLKYFMALGSLLGIVRHKGFIPWDDDLDICMPRKDYDKFIAIAPKELKEPYFLQVPGNDKDYFYSFAKLRNSNTAAVSYTFRYCEYNQGIGVDIFIMDNCHLNTVEENWMRQNALILENSTNMRRTNPYPSPADIERMKTFPARDPQAVLAEMHAVSSSANKKQSDYCVVSQQSIYKYHRVIYRWADILDVENVDFYGYKVFAPKNADSILTTTYGDYMRFPPIEERGIWHNSVVLDPDTPYMEVLERLRASDKKIRVQDNFRR